MTYLFSASATVKEKVWALLSATKAHIVQSEAF